MSTMNVFICLVLLTAFFSPQPSSSAVIIRLRRQSLEPLPTPLPVEWPSSGTEAPQPDDSAATALPVMVSTTGPAQPADSGTPPVPMVLLVSQTPAGPSQPAADGTYSLDPEVNHRITLTKQEEVLAAGQALSLGITQALVRPFVLVNNHISQAAASLPYLFAANGALLGNAIATPIQLGTLAANNIAAGITGTLVSLPISVVSGGAAQMVGAYESGRQLYKGKVAELAQGVQAVKQSTVQYLARPVALIGGANSVAGGIVLSVAGGGAKHLGAGANLIGAHINSAGEHLAGIGSSLQAWGNGPETAQVITGAPAIALMMATTEAPLVEETTTQVSPTLMVDEATTEAILEPTMDTTTQVPSDLLVNEATTEAILERHQRPSIYEWETTPISSATELPLTSSSPLPSI